MNNVANIQLLNGTEKIKDSYGKINTSMTNLNNAKVEKTGDTMTGDLAFSGSARGFYYLNGNNQSVAKLACFPETTSADVVVRMFSDTNTSGNKIFQLLAGDGTASMTFQITNGRVTNLNGLWAEITAYAGNPNGNVAAPPGSICLNTSGGAGTSIYVKESGTGNTGWVAK